MRDLCSACGGGMDPSEHYMDDFEQFVLEARENAIQQ